MGSAIWPESGSGTGDLTSVASADGSLTVTGGGGPDVDLAILRSLATGLPGAWNTITIGAAVQDHDISGLNGDVDGGYELWIYLINAAGTSALTIQPNALATNQAGPTIYYQSVSVLGTDRTALNVCYALNTGNAGAGQSHVFIQSTTGKSRLMIADSVNGGSAAGTAIHELNKVLWTDTATNITSLRLHSSIASGIGVGSIFKWRKLFAGI